MLVAHMILRSGWRGTITMSTISTRRSTDTSRNTGLRGGRFTNTQQCTTTERVAPMHCGVQRMMRFASYELMDASCLIRTLPCVHPPRVPHRRHGARLMDRAHRTATWRRTVGNGAHGRERSASRQNKPQRWREPNDSGFCKYQRPVCVHDAPARLPCRTPALITHHSVCESPKFTINRPVTRRGARAPAPAGRMHARRAHVHRRTTRYVGIPDKMKNRM